MYYIVGLLFVKEKGFLNMRLIFCLLFSCLFVSDAIAKVRVVDGDSLVVDGQDVRLWGIDAPEYNQTCYDAKGIEYVCGDVSFQYLKGIVGDNVVCESIVVDRYKRQVSVCDVDGININEKMVESGMAVVYGQYSNEYEDVQVKAKESKSGIWQGKFMNPELFRALNR